MAMEGGGMMDVLMDIIRDKVEQAKADDAIRTKRERERRLKQQRSNKTSSTHKNQGR